MIKSSFSSYLHDKVRIILIREEDISIDKICCQYNPDKFDSYRKYTFQIGNPLSIQNSPHYDLLKRLQSFGRDKLILHIKNTNYWLMQKAYGRDDKWIMDKVNKFLDLYTLANKGTVLEMPDILDKPIITNPYNSEFEIWEGHHRMAIFAILKYEKVKCKIYRWEANE